MLINKNYSVLHSSITPQDLSRLDWLSGNVSIVPHFFLSDVQKRRQTKSKEMTVLHLPLHFFCSFSNSCRYTFIGFAISSCILILTLVKSTKMYILTRYQRFSIDSGSDLKSHVYVNRPSGAVIEQASAKLAGWIW